MGEFRLRRIEHQLRDAISSLIMGDEIKDPRLSTFVSITDVKVSKDLAHAKVFLSSFQERRRLESSVEALNHASGYIRGRLGRKLGLRVTPAMTFVADTSIADGFTMTRKMEELNP